jgi:hypothetical protein
MTTITAPSGVSLMEIELAVEGLLAKHLLKERMRSLPNEVDREQCEAILDAFEDWADAFGVPTTPYVLAAWFVELYYEHGLSMGELQSIARAYLAQHDRDVHVPIRAALNFCSR